MHHGFFCWFFVNQSLTDPYYFCETEKSLEAGIRDIKRFFVAFTLSIELYETKSGSSSFWWSLKCCEGLDKE